MEKFTITPNGINHNQSPAFVAAWLSGEEAEASRQAEGGYYYQGSGEYDQLLINPIEWQDDQPEDEEYQTLMDAAITALDSWIMARC